MQDLSIVGGDDSATFPTSREVVDSNAFFFNLPQNQELFSKLESFHRSDNTSSCVAVLVGAMSSGKTTFLKSFMTGDKKGRRYIQAGFKLDKDDLPLDELAHVEMPLLVIDDADRLSAENLQKLLLMTREQCPELKLILAGEATLLEKMDGLKEIIPLFTPNAFFLDPLSFKETKAYLKQSLNHSLSITHKFFTKNNLEAMYALSKGYIGRINRVAVQFAAHHKNKKLTVLGRFSWVDIALTLAITCLLAVVGWRIYLLRSSHVAPPHEKTVPLIHKSKKIRAREFIELNNPTFIASIENLPEEVIESPVDDLLILPEPKHTHLKKK